MGSEPPWVRGLEERLRAAFRDDLNAAIGSLRGEVDAVRQQVEVLAGENAALRDRVIAAEARDMRNNLILRGPGLAVRAPDNPRETWDASLEVVRGVFTDLGVDPAPHTERVHRLGGYRSGQERAIVIKFSSFRDREKILAMKREIRQHDLWFTEQFPPEILDHRRRLREAAERKFGALGDGRAGTTKAILSFDCLKVNGSTYTLGADDALIPARGADRAMRQQGTNGDSQSQLQQDGFRREPRPRQQPGAGRGRGGRGGNRGVGGGHLRSRSVASPNRKRQTEEQLGQQAKMMREWSNVAGGSGSQPPRTNGVGSQAPSAPPLRLPQNDGAGDDDEGLFSELLALVKNARARRPAYHHNY